MRKTQATLRVLLAFTDDVHGQYWGYDLGKRAGVRSGVLYPILHRMLDEGWLIDGWEEPSAGRKKRPPRRYYELTPEGIKQLGVIIAASQHDARFGELLGGMA